MNNLFTLIHTGAYFVQRLLELYLINLYNLSRMKPIRFYALLYCEDTSSSIIHNFSLGAQNTPNGKNDFAVYVDCCTNLHRSLAEKGYGLTVLTNNSPYIIAYQKDKDYNFAIQEIPFTLNVPQGIAFYGAHHKIDAYAWFAKQKNEYSILVDIDVIATGKIPQSMLNAIYADLPLYYDITMQIYPGACKVTSTKSTFAGNGEERVIHDKKLLDPNAKTCLWAGGEFIGGSASFFAKLYKQICKYTDAYFANSNLLFHQGDEMLTSTAIEALILDGVPIVNAGAFCAISRYWSVGTEHCQLLWRAVKNSFMLHLPADKNFIASTPYDDNFLSKYEHYLQSEKTIDTSAQIPRLFLMRVKNKIRKLCKL